MQLPVATASCLRRKQKVLVSNWFFYKLKSSPKQKGRPIMKLGQKIAELRKKSGLSQEALAEKNECQSPSRF